ncbi:MAG: hypothetical protein ACTSYU_04795 [Promethearchaeota archaeon]
MVSNVTAQDDTWSREEVTSNPGFAAIIDGEKEDDWSSNVNFTDYVLNGLQFKVFVQHFGDYLYFLVEARFTTQTQDETVSLYFASTNQTSDINDKKQITIFNASQSGNETSNFTDYYLSSSEYQIDQNDLGFTGAGAIGESNFRTYEFKILLEPEENSSTEDVELNIYNNYAVQLGYNNSDDDTERISETLLVQIGPKSSAGIEGEIGEFDFNTELYIIIVLIIVSVFTIGYGVAVFTSKQKVGIIYVDELDEEDLEEA